MIWDGFITQMDSWLQWNSFLGKKLSLNTGKVYHIFRIIIEQVIISYSHMDSDFVTPILIG